MDRKGSSPFSATLTRVRTTASDKGTLPPGPPECVPGAVEVDGEVRARSIAARMSLRHWTFSELCLASRVNVLGKKRYPISMESERRSIWWETPHTV